MTHLHSFGVSRVLNPRRLAATCARHYGIDRSPVRISFSERPRMSGFWSFLGSKKNREILGWLGGGIVAVIVALWTVFVYLHPLKGDVGEGKGGVSASHGGVSVGGNVSNSTIETKSTTGGDTQPPGY